MIFPKGFHQCISVKKKKHNEGFMKFVQMLVLIFLALGSVRAETLPDLIGFSDGKAAYLFLPHPIPTGQGVVLWKKVGKEEWRKAFPVVIRPIDDPYQMQKLLGGDYAVVAKTMKDPDPTRILTKLKKDAVYSLMLCFKVPRLSMLLGRLITDAQIAKGQTVWYKVEFVDDGNKPVRQSDAIRVKIKKPAVPEVGKLRVSINNRFAAISFDYPKFTWQKPDWVVGFRLYRSEDGANYYPVGEDFIFRLDQSSITVQDGLLDYGKTYWYKVTTISYFGYESRGCSPLKIYVKDKEPPSIVQNIRAEYTGNGILVSWDLNPEPDITGYEVYRGTDADNVTRLLNKTPVPAVQNYFLDSLGQEGEKYFYGIIAIDRSGNKSKISARPGVIWEDKTPPPPPKNLKADYIKGKIRLSWQPVAKEPLRGYYVYRGLDKDHLVQLTSVPIGKKTHAYADSGSGNKKFQYGKTYWLAVRAVDMSWNLSDYSYMKITLPDTIPPQPSSGVMVEVRKNGDVYINWNPSPSPDVARYIVALYEAGQKQPFIVKQVGKDTLNGFFPQLTKGKTYTLQIVSVDQAGNQSITALTKKIEVRDYVPPPHPRNVFVHKTKNGYNISWNKVVDFDFLGYRIYRAASPTGTYQPAVETLIKKEEYLLPKTAPQGYYQVRAVDTSGNESKKNEVVYIGSAKR